MPKIVRRVRLYVGVDPGVSGGLALLSDGGEVHAVAMPATERDLWDWFYELPDAEMVAVLEQVGGFIKGAPAFVGNSMFKFGTSYGLLRMALTAADVPFETATPQKWQKALGIPTRRKTESPTQWKNRLKARAQQLFPKVKVTLATSDALLIAEYCRRKHEGRA